jgi:hypothetical protein
MHITKKELKKRKSPATTSIPWSSRTDTTKTTPEVQQNPHSQNNAFNKDIVKLRPHIGFSPSN